MPPDEGLTDPLAGGRPALAMVVGSAAGCRTMTSSTASLPSTHPPPPRGGPFATVRGPVALVLAGMAATGVWVVAGPWLPGGRWLAVHLFTLAVLTPAIVAFSAHFTGSLLFTRAAVRPPMALLGIGTVLTLVGVSARMDWVAGTGATVLTVAVTSNYWRLRRARKATLQPRWVWMVRRWERSHGAFVHGAILGLLLAVGVLPGAWYATARLSHLHVQLLGWGGLTLLATSCMFGPMALRSRMPEHAPHVIAIWTARAATALTIGVFSLLVSAVGGGPGTALRVVAALAVGIYAVGAVAVLRVLLEVRAGAPAQRWPGDAIVLGVAAVATAAALDVPVLVLAAWRYHDALGVLVLGGLLLAITGALAAVGPWLVGDGKDGRDRVRDALDRHGAIRVRLLASGVVLAAVGAAWHGAGVRPLLVRGGWGLVVLALAWSFAVVATTRTRRQPSAGA